MPASNRYVFTFHYVSINTVQGDRHRCILETLHSTMFLLILSFGYLAECGCLFTFHYVSINTVRSGHDSHRGSALHSTMFLLIRKARLKTCGPFLTLHSTMFLLIQRQADPVRTAGQTLHSTMFLLIRSRPPMLL